jgi:SAM-dependent methyltransferase
MLDLGCGGGLLGRVAMHFGHDYVGTDIGNPMFMAMCEALGVKALASPVRSREPLPAELTGFDLVTSINPMFYRRELIGGRSEQFWWGDEDWDFFLRDLRSRLRPRGVYYSKFNAEEQLPPGLWRLLDRCRRFDQKSFLIRYDQLPK